MTDVPDVNADSKPEIPDSESAGGLWVDPIHLENNPEKMPDEIALEAQRGAPAELEPPAMGSETRPAEGEDSTDQTALEEIAGEGEDTKGDRKEGKEAEKPEEPEGSEDTKTDTATDDENKAAEAEPAEEAEEEQESEAESEDEGEEAEAPQRRPRRRSRSRRDRRAQEREISALRGQVETLTKLVGDLQKPAAETGDDEGAGEAQEAEEAPAPKLEDYDYDTDKWTEAMTEWTKEQISAGQRKAEETQAKTRAQEQRQQQAEKFGELQDVARERYEDYDDVVYGKDASGQPLVPISPQTADLIVASDNGAEVAYYLATHTDEAHALYEMTDPMQVARQFGRIEAVVHAQPERPAEKAPPATPAAEKPPEKPTPSPQQRREATQAPPPPSHVSGGRAGHAPDPAKMSMDEYSAGRRSGKIR